MVFSMMLVDVKFQVFKPFSRLFTQASRALSLLSNSLLNASTCVVHLLVNNSSFGNLSNLLNVEEDLCVKAYDPSSTDGKWRWALLLKVS